MKTTTLPFKHSINRVPRQLALLIPLALASLALLPQARAVCQEGCLTNNNTVLGDDALVNNTGTDNTAIGFNALFSNTTGSWNTATGDFVLYSNTTGLHNTATGSGALESNREGGGNTANGFQALGSTTGSSNTGIGYQALAFNTRGTNNIALGASAGINPLLAATIYTLATLVLQENPSAFASARAEHRQKHLSLAFLV